MGFEPTAAEMREQYTHFDDEYRQVYAEMSESALAASVERGLEQSAAGDVRELGDFTAYVND